MLFGIPFNLEQKSSARYRLLIFAAALLFSTGGVAIRWTSLSGWQVAGFRSGVAALILLIALPAARRGWTWRMVPVACAYAATLITFVIATKQGTAASAIFLQSSAPLYLLILSPLVLKEKVRRGDWIVFLLLASGMALLLRDGFSGGGRAVGVCSGIAWACTLTGLRWLEKRGDAGAGQATVALGNGIAFALCLPAALPIHHVPATDILIVIYLGVFQIALAYFCLTTSIRHVPAVETATLLLIEPVFNPAWAWLLHGENPGSFALAGGCLILLSTAVSIRVHSHI